MAPGNLLVHQAIRRAIAVSGMGVVRRAEVEDRPQPSLPAQRNPVPQIIAPLLACFAPGLAAERHDLRILLVLFGAELNHVFDVKWLISRTPPPGHV